MKGNKVTRIYISNSPENLDIKLRSSISTATVEAEYGDKVVNGSLVTLAHHGDRGNCPCPCLGDNFSLPVISKIGVSHFDLDTLGGVMRILAVKGYEPAEEYEFTAEGFWEVAAQIDVKGPHKLDKIISELAPGALDCMNGPDENDPGYGSSMDRWDDHVDWIKQSLNAFWAWSEANRLFAPRDGSVLDCTAFFLEAIRVLTLILEDDSSNKEAQALIQSGSDWAKKKEKLAEESLRLEANGILVRSSDQFVNHLYTDKSSVIVAYNPSIGSITLSTADPIEDFDCCNIMQGVFGPEAGGHSGIAGTPRGVFHYWQDVWRVVSASKKIIEKA